jgi:hypothetical protein
MRIDDECRDPELLAAEVRRLQAVIAAGETTLTETEREAIEWALEASIYYAGAGHRQAKESAATLRNLLERMK